MGISGNKVDPNKHVEINKEELEKSTEGIEVKVDSPVNDEAENVKGDEEIVVKKSELQVMINEGIENYRQQQPQPKIVEDGWAEVEPGKERHKTATLRLYQKDTKSPYAAIIRADFLKMVWDEETHKHNKMLYELELMYEDGKKEVIEMDGDSFVKLGQREVVELIDVDRKKMRQVTGKASIPLKDSEGYPILKMNAGGFGSAKSVIGEVELEVIRFEEIFTVKRPSGQKFKIHSKYLNA